MTELEQRIIDAIIPQLPTLLQAIKEKALPNVHEGIKYVVMNLSVDGIRDDVYYDIELKKFTKIQYWYGKQNATKTPIDNEFTAAFDKDDIEMREIDISNIKQSLGIL